MTDAWQTYHDQARKMLDGAQDETSALVGVGWAVLTLVEVLKPQAEQTLVVDTKPVSERLVDAIDAMTADDINPAWCGETSAHGPHRWHVMEDTRRLCRGITEGGAEPVSLTTEQCAVHTPHLSHPWYSSAAVHEMDRMCPGVAAGARERRRCGKDVDHAGHEYQTEHDAPPYWCDGNAVID